MELKFDEKGLIPAIVQDLSLIHISTASSFRAIWSPSPVRCSKAGGTTC